MKNEQSLSEQICELCGIEPKYHFYDDTVNPIVDNFLTKKEIIDGYVDEKSPFESYKQFEIYPDFENDTENKVKLLDLIVDAEYNTKLIEVLTVNSFIFRDTNAMLERLIEVLKTDRDKESIKQAIAAEKWELREWHL